MKFRDAKVDDVKILEDNFKVGLEKQIKNIKGTIIDLQYATPIDGLWSALVLIQNNNKENDNHGNK